MTKPNHFVVLLVLILGSLCFVRFLAAHGLPREDISASLRTAADAVEYLQLADGFAQNVPMDNLSDVISRRPPLYPLLVSVGLYLAGDLGVYLFNFCFWLLTSVLIFFGVTNLSKNAALGVSSALLFATHPGIWAYTQIAMTEVFSAMLYAIAIIAIAHMVQIGFTPKLWAAFLFVFGCIGSTRSGTWPVFSILLAITVLLGIILRWPHRKTFATLSIGAIPMIVAVVFTALMGQHMSIGAGADYPLLYFTGAIKYKQGLCKEIESCIASASETLPRLSDKLQYFRENWEITKSTYIYTLKFENFLTRNHMISSFYPELVPRDVFLKVTFQKFHDQWQYIAAVGLLTAGNNRLRAGILLLLLLFAGSTLQYGINFTQGDRYMLPSFPIWCALYTTVFTVTLTFIVKVCAKVVTIFSCKINADKSLPNESD
jgi:hypothetical protein